MNTTPESPQDGWSKLDEMAVRRELDAYFERNRAVQFEAPDTGPAPRYSSEGDIGKEERLLKLIANWISFLSFGIFFGGIGFIIADETTLWLLGLDPYEGVNLLVGWVGGLVGFVIVGVIAGRLGVRLTSWVSRRAAAGLAAMWDRV